MKKKQYSCFKDKELTPKVIKLSSITFPTYFDIFPKPINLLFVNFLIKEKDAIFVF